MHSFMIGRQAGQNLVEVWYLNTNFNTLWEYLINRIKYLESCILGSSLNLFGYILITYTKLVYMAHNI